MTIEHPTTCPPWCDPRAHVQSNAHACEHRDMPLAWKVAADDYEVSVCRSQLEDTEPGDTVRDLSDEAIRLELRSLDGDNAQPVGVDLSPADARLLAAALVFAAERRGHTADQTGVV